MGGVIAKQLQWKDPSHLEDSVENTAILNEVINFSCSHFLLEVVGEQDRRTVQGESGYL